MISEKTQNLINKLIDLTVHDKILWGTTNRDTEYSLSFNSGTITTDRWYDHENESNRIDFVIYNNNGIQIEVLRFSQEDNPGWYHIIDSLYTVIHRKYLKVDETIDGIFKEMEDKEIDF